MSLLQELLRVGVVGGLGLLGVVGVRLPLTRMNASSIWHRLVVAADGLPGIEILRIAFEVLDHAVISSSTEVLGCKAGRQVLSLRNTMVCTAFAYSAADPLGFQILVMGATQHVMGALAIRRKPLLLRSIASLVH